MNLKQDVNPDMSPIARLSKRNSVTVGTKIIS